MNPKEYIQSKLVELKDPLEIKKITDKKILMSEIFRLLLKT